jgi:16S rRNA (adenine1518-N6/adenine1519-N6)-dimethyltransferase
MLQKEVGDRISAKPGTKSYGSLSVAIQYYSEPETVMTVPKTVFNPQPNVDSSVIRLKMRKTPPVELDDSAYFFTVVRACFGQRRKTILNNLTNNLEDGKKYKKEIEEALQSTNIDPKRRGETLTIEEFALLSNTLKRTIG